MFGGGIAIAEPQMRNLCGGKTPAEFHRLNYIRGVVAAGLHARNYNGSIRYAELQTWDC